MKRLINIFLRTRLVFLILLSLQVFDPLYSQAGLQDLTEKLDLWLQKYPEEAVYIQTDRSVYSPGDRIFFRACVTDETGKQPEVSGRKLYIKLFDINGFEIAGSGLAFSNKSFGGYLDMPKYIQDGNYLVAAYTGWMENYSAERAFFKQISVSDKKTDNLDVAVKSEGYLCMPSSTIKLKLSFKGKDDKPVPAAFDYELTGLSATNLNGKGRANKEGNADISFMLPDFTEADNPEIIIHASYRSSKVNKGLFLATPYNYLDVAFYPEGGKLLEGIRSKVAFRSFDNVNRPVDFKGVVYDNDNNQVCTISPVYKGLGSFFLTPEEGKKYILKVTGPGHYSKEFPLPQPERSGLVITVNDINDDTLTLSPKATGNSATSFNLLLHMKGRIFRTLAFSASDLRSIKMPVNNLPAGIAEIVVFDQSLNLVSKRLVYLHKNRKLGIGIETGSPEKAANGETTIMIKSFDENGKPVKADLGLSVVGKDFEVQFPDNYSITSWNKLGNDLIGYLPVPDYFLDSSSLEILDNLILANAYSHFTWHKIKDMRAADIPFKNIKEGSEQDSRYRNDLCIVASRELVYSMKSPGLPFTIPDSNKRWERNVEEPKDKREYDSNIDIMSLIARFEPYRLVDGKIVFSKSGPNSNSKQDGALIVINGTPAGDNPSVLKGIPPNDIDHINVSTNFIDIQKYTGFNTMGVIEIYTKSGQKNSDVTPAIVSKSSKGNIAEPDVESRYVSSKGTILWAEDIHTDSTGKAMISLDHVKSPGNVIITVEGCTEGGLTGRTSLEYDMR